MHNRIRSSRAIALVAIAHGAGGIAVADVSGGYIYRTPTEIDFLTVTQTEHKLSGYIQSVSKNIDVDQGFSSSRLSFEGEISGTSCTIHARNSATFFGGLIDCSANISGGVFKLFIPAQNGLTSTLRFEKSNADAWNKYVVSFEKKCSIDAFRQAWRVAYQARTQGDNNQWKRAKQDAEQIGSDNANLRGHLADEQKQLDIANANLKTAHKARDYYRSEADKMAEIAKDAQAFADSPGQGAHGFLGLVPTDLSNEQRAALQTNGGASVQQVISSGPAASAGIEANDIVVRIGDIPVTSPIDLLHAVLKNPPGSSLEIEILRAGKHQTLSVSLSARPLESDQVRQLHASQLSNASSQAENRVSQAENRISSADNAVQSVKNRVDRVQGEIDSTGQELQSVNRLLRRIEAEASILNRSQAYLKRLWSGALWTGVASEDGAITDWPTADASSVFSISRAQRMSVVPLADGWCIVMLPQKRVGWIRSSAVRITGGEAPHA